MRRLEIDALYARHREDLLVFLARRTADPQIALDLWAETFAQALAGGHRYRGSTDDEAAGWLYTIARRQLALYYRRGRTEQRALARLELEREPASPELLAEVAQRAGLGELRAELAVLRPWHRQVQLHRPRLERGRARTPARLARTDRARLRDGPRR